HRDHTAANRLFGGEVVAHENVRRRLEVAQVFQGHPVSAAPREEWPDRSYSDTLLLELGGEHIELRHLQGAHTDGDTIVVFRDSNVVALGDVFAPGRFPYVDPDMNGNPLMLAQHVDRLISELPPDASLVPGHFGPVATMNELRAFAHM